MYAKIENNVAVKWPYTKDDLRKDNPQTSFPSTMSDELLLAYGVVDVFIINQPEVDYTKNVTQQDPAFNSERNRWETSWVVTDATPEEIEERVASQAASIRIERNVLIAESDWTQLDDTPISNSKKLEWAAYRQSLRDLPLQPGFPWEVTWPVNPA